MKRKAMLMGMAFMTSLPGWALAKGASKGTDQVHAYAVGVEALPLQQLEVENVPLAPDTAEGKPRKASEVLAQIKSMLRGANYGAVMKPATQGWAMELLEGNAGGLGFDAGDPRLQGAKPLGVAFRLRF